MSCAIPGLFYYDTQNTVVVEGFVTFISSSSNGKVKIVIRKKDGDEEDFLIWVTILFYLAVTPDQNFNEA